MKAILTMERTQLFSAEDVQFKNPAKGIILKADDGYQEKMADTAECAKESILKSILVQWGGNHGLSTPNILMPVCVTAIVRPL